MPLDTARKLLETPPSSDRFKGAAEKSQLLFVSESLRTGQELEEAEQYRKPQEQQLKNIAEMQNPLQVQMHDIERDDQEFDGVKVIYL